MKQTDTDLEALHDYIQDFCLKLDIHEVCFYCGRNCQMPWSDWNGMMPPEEYCGNYLEHPLWRLVFGND